MRHGLQLAGITRFWLVGPNIDWDCLENHCIMGSCDQWEFPPFFWPQWQSLCAALTVGSCLPLGLCKGTVKEPSRGLVIGMVDSCLKTNCYTVLAWWTVRALLHRTLHCLATLRCLEAPLIGSSWFQQASLHWRAAVWRCAANWVPEPIYGAAVAAAHFGTNPSAGETVPFVKAPWRPLATAPLPLTNSVLCKRSSSNGAARQRSAVQRCSKTAPCVKAASDCQCGMRHGLQ